MKSRKLIIAAGVLFLTACQGKQPLTERVTADTEPVVSAAFTQEEISGEERVAVAETAGDTVETAEDTTETAGDVVGSKAAKIPVIPQSDVAFEGYPEQTDYDSIEALSVEPVKEEEGGYGGSPAIWSTLNDGKFLHFYVAINGSEGSEPEYAAYAIIGEEVELACGLQVGMTAEEAERIIPGLYHFKWEDSEYHSVLDWNPHEYPDNWSRKFPQILIAEVDDGHELPLTIGLMLDEQETIRAIAFNHPTAG